MDYFVQIFLLILPIGLVVGGVFLIVSGRIKRRYTQGYEMIYEGLWVRVLGLLLLLLGMTAGLTVVKTVSGMAGLVLSAFILLSGAIISHFVQQNGVVKK